MTLPPNLKIAIAQLNATVGDFNGNVEKLAQAARGAHARGAHILITPEMYLCGYPPHDLVKSPEFLRQLTLFAELAGGFRIEADTVLQPLSDAIAKQNAAVSEPYRPSWPPRPSEPVT